MMGSKEVDHAAQICFHVSTYFVHIYIYAIVKGSGCII